jgi:hypothetical protein
MDVKVMGRLVNIETADIFSNNLNLCTSIKIKLLRSNVLRSDNLISVLDDSDYYKSGYFTYKIIEEPYTNNLHIYLYPKEDNDINVFNIINMGINNIIAQFGYADLNNKELSYLSACGNLGFLFTCNKIARGTYLINI